MAESARAELAKEAVGKSPVQPGPKPSSAGEKVTVACKIPNGMVLQLYDMENRVEPSPGGPKTVPVAVKRDAPVKVRGPALPFGVFPRSFQIESGYALTPGVDREFFEEWLKQHADSDAVLNHLIFAETTEDRARGKAREMAAMRSGMEPLDMTTTDARGKIADPRVPQGIRKGDKNEDAA